MLARLDLRGFSGDLAARLARSRADGDAPLEIVREIIQDVRERGDDALREYTERFDGCSLDDFEVGPDEIANGLEQLTPDERAALEYARDEIRAYHEAQLTPVVDLDRDGVSLREIVVPMSRVGCYVPGGRAAYPSTVLMTSVPARVAGVGEVVLCVPPDRDGNVPAPTLAAAALAGVDRVFRVGGAQAIAALAYGTKSIPRVDLVVGPGNIYVSTAKREVAGDVAIESLAGPSELVVVADESASPELVAADLLAQTEHGPDGAAVLVTWSEAIAQGVDDALVALLADAPRRDDIVSAFSAGGQSVLVDGPEQAMAVANTIAPEHLELMTSDPEALVPEVRNAGAVFCGPLASAVIGDYVAGVNHVLPTGGSARFSSALRVDDFCKHVHVVSMNADALRRVSPHVQAFAEMEGLTEHGRSVALRETEE
jgi:histidinol dehydrogenase